MYERKHGGRTQITRKMANEREYRKKNEERERKGGRRRGSGSGREGGRKTERGNPIPERERERKPHTRVPAPEASGVAVSPICPAPGRRSLPAGIPLPEHGRRGRLCRFRPRRCTRADPEPGCIPGSAGTGGPQGRPALRAAPATRPGPRDSSHRPTRIGPERPIFPTSRITRITRAGRAGPASRPRPP